MKNKCQCMDPGCPAHKNVSNCKRGAIHTVYRIDMADRTGTMLCDDCAANCFDSGLFSDEPNFYSEY